MPSHFRMGLMWILIGSSALALANPDNSWRELDDGEPVNLVAGLILFAIVALVIHLVESGQFLRSLVEFAKSIAWLASLYLTLFCIVFVIGAISAILQALGLEKSIASWIALPVGLVVGFKLAWAYLDWRTKRKRGNTEPEIPQSPKLERRVVIHPVEPGQSGNADPRPIHDARVERKDSGRSAHIRVTAHEELAKIRETGSPGRAHAVKDIDPVGWTVIAIVVLFLLALVL